MPDFSLREPFERYRADNPDGAWLDGYRAVCEQIAAIRDGRQALGADFLENIWTGRDTGVAYVSQGCMSAAIFGAVRSEAEELTRLLVDDPSPGSLDEALARWRRRKEEGGIPWIPYAMTYRLLAAAAPERYTTLVYDKYYWILHNWLVSQYNVSLPGNEKNWAERNIALRRALVNLGCRDDDPWLLNTFAWNLARDAAQPSLPGGRGEDFEADDGRADPWMLAQQEAEAAGVETELPASLNTIFYGPPGTGKTRHVQLLLKEHFTPPLRDLSDEEWREEIFSPLSWRDVTAAALADAGGSATVPQLAEHPFIRAKAGSLASASLRATLWSRLQTHTPRSSKTVHYGSRSDPAVFDKRDDAASTWFLLPGWREACPEAAEALERRARGRQPDQPVRRYEMVTFHQSYSYEDFVEGIRPLLRDDEPGGMAYEMRPGVFLNLCERARTNPGQRYALFIDEINRGNMAKIFGEALSLIEDTKREGRPEAMEIRLPYSGRLFSVPPNLYIFGSMNTADRSLALLDTALRRRFHFEEMQPDPTLLENLVVEGVRLEPLLAALNQRIEALYDRDHTIGHAYFLGPGWEHPTLGTLKNVFLKRIFPLLQEYFFDDQEKIRLVLGDNHKEQKGLNRLAFLQRDDRNERLFGVDDVGSARYTYNDAILLNPDAYVGIYDLPRVLRQA